MAQFQALQGSRFEWKYLVDEARAGAIRDFVSAYLEPDAYTRPECGNSYQVYSLYLDTPSLSLLRQTTQGLKNRFKLRIRFYDGDAASPAYLEIKRRTTDVIRKQRAAISREGVRRLLEGGYLDVRQLVVANGHGPKLVAAAEEFWALKSRLEAVGVVYVAYVREAYVSPSGNQVRVTFDRELFGAPYQAGGELVVPQRGVRAGWPGVVLELKFTNRFPSWLCEMVQAFDLQRRSLAKYVRCAEAIGLSEGRRILSEGIAQWTPTG